MNDVENYAFAFDSTGCRIFMNELLCFVKYYLQQYPALYVAEQISKIFKPEDITYAKNLLFYTLYLSVPLNESCKINHEVTTVGEQFGKYTERRGQNKSKSEGEDIIKYFQRADAMSLKTPMYTTPCFAMTPADSWTNTDVEQNIGKLTTEVSELKRLVIEHMNEMKEIKTTTYAKAATVQTV